MVRFFARGLTRGWDGKNADGRDYVLAPDGDLITDLDDMRRLRGISVERDAAGVTKFLGQRTATTEPACLKEKIETHIAKAKEQEAGAGRRKKPRSFL